VERAEEGEAEAGVGEGMARAGIQEEQEREVAATTQVRREAESATPVVSAILALSATARSPLP
jgi:hypothetical protein